jgi:hypothetical protein
MFKFLRFLLYSPKAGFREDEEDEKERQEGPLLYLQKDFVPVGVSVL